MQHSSLKIRAGVALLIDPQKFREPRQLRSAAKLQIHRAHPPVHRAGEANAYPLQVIRRSLAARAIGAASERAQDKSGCRKPAFRSEDFRK
jgi:hypothetical protein